MSSSSRSLFFSSSTVSDSLPRKPSESGERAKISAKTSSAMHAHVAFLIRRIASPGRPKTDSSSFFSSFIITGSGTIAPLGISANLDSRLRSAISSFTDLSVAMPGTGGGDMAPSEAIMASDEKLPSVSESKLSSSSGVISINGVDFAIRALCPFPFPPFFPFFADNEIKDVRCGVATTVRRVGHDSACPPKPVNIAGAPT
mmetsp:Transcript_41731/g.83653  ORF Transcript_41731/g.83653 Transcript_41731/m.83653 type:complete len:201 (+) Transcript_41731:200-802(+)